MSISSPSALPLPTNVYPQIIAYDSVNQYLYITGNNNGLYRVYANENISSGSATYITSIAGMSGTLTQMGVNTTNNTLYLNCNGSTVIYYVDLDSVSPTLQTLSITGSIPGTLQRGLVTYGNYLYVADTSNLYQIDITTLVSTATSTTSTLGGCMSTDGTSLYILYIFDNYVYMATVDISTLVINYNNASEDDSIYVKVGLTGGGGVELIVNAYMNNLIYISWYQSGSNYYIAQFDTSINVQNQFYLNPGSLAPLNATASSSQLYLTFTNSFLVYGLTRVVCFLEGTKILCQIGGFEVYLPVQSLRKGTLVKTYKHGFVPVHIIAKKIIYNLGTDERVKERLYRCSKENYPELIDDLFITGCHSILVDDLTEYQMKTSMELWEDRVYMTEDKFRLMAFLDDKAQPWNNEGEHVIWHFALETDDYFVNHGVYANGLLVETSSKRFLIELSNMDIIE